MNVVYFNDEQLLTLESILKNSFCLLDIKITAPFHLLIPPQVDVFFLSSQSQDQQEKFL